MPGSRARYAQAAGGAAGVRALEAALRSTVDEVGPGLRGRVDRLRLRQGRPAVGRHHRRPSSPGCAPGSPRIREWGDGDDVYQFLSREETRGAGQRRRRARRALRARERAHPAGRARGRASPRRRSGAACEIYEATPVTAIEPRERSPGAAAGAVARTKFGDVRARSVLRCTEGYTAALPGLRRALLPMNSHMVVTEPLAPRPGRRSAGTAARRWATRRTPTCTRSAPRTAGSRSAGAASRTGSPRRPTISGETDPSTVAALTGVLRRMFPAAASARIDARLVRRARRAARLVRHGDLQPRVGTRLGGRLHRGRGRRVQPRRAAPSPTW